MAAALAKAQGQLQGAKKDSENPFFKSKYADLSAVWEACRTPLAQNGLAVIQTTDAEDENGSIPVETILVHESGEWISGLLKVRPVKDDPQGMGSALTYARRYALSAIVGVAPEDDDGNAASQPSGGRQAQKSRPQPQTTDQAARKGLLDQAEGISRKLGYPETKIKAAMTKLRAMDTPTMGESVQKLSDALKEKTAGQSPEDAAKASTLTSIQEEFKKHEWDEGDVGRYLAQTWGGKKLEEMSLDNLIAVHDELTGTAAF